MANVLDALKNLYLKIGGDKSKLNDNHDISDYVNDIGVALKDAIESSTELPIVSVDDNGKALGVVDGNWGKMNIPSEVPAAAAADIGKVLGVVSDGASGAEYGAVSVSNAPYFIKFEYDTTVTGTQFPTCDKTFSEIKAAFNAGRPIFAQFRDTGMEETIGYFPISKHNNFWGVESFDFFAYEDYSSTMQCTIITVRSEVPNTEIYFKQISWSNGHA